jgi:hypothetical protein
MVSNTKPAFALNPFTYLGLDFHPFCAGHGDVTRALSYRNRVFAGIASLFVSFWIAICAAAPEFIWQGLRIAFGHLGLADLLAALVIGLILAFFVEPLMELVRELFRQARNRAPADPQPRNILFTASLSLAFALVSVAVHDAMTAFVSDRGAAHMETSAGLAAVISLTTAWAVVPLTVTIAWLSAGCRWLKLPTGITAGASSCIAGWLFSWSVQEIISTTVPGLVILILGYREVAKEPRPSAFMRCARNVGLSATSWFIFALLLDSLLGFCHLDQFKLYTAPAFWMDVRFHLGWVLGLVFAPFPLISGVGSGTHQASGFD